MAFRIYSFQRRKPLMAQSFSTHSVTALQFTSHSESLNEGIVSLSNICKSLLDADVDPITGMCSNYKQIREHIEYSEQCMRKAETMIKEKLKHLDERMEQLTQDKQNAEQRKTQTCMAMNKLHIEKKSAEESLQNYKAALTQAEKNLESAKYALRVAQNRRNTGDGVAAAGAALLIVPVLGWIAGPIMLSKGIRAYNEASEAVSAAENEQQTYELKVMDRNNDVSQYKTKIQCKQVEIEKTSETVKRIEEEIEGVQKHLEEAGNVQEKVRIAVNLLGVLHGRVTVLEKQTKRFILWEPVVKILEEVMNAIVNIAESRLFYSDGVPGLIKALRENVGGLQALCKPPSNSEHESYY